MRLTWDSAALSDVERLHAFLASKSLRAAMDAVDALFAAPEILLHQPRIGTKVEGAVDEEIRRLLVGGYELWYAIRGDEVRIVRVFSEREDR